MTDEHKDQNVTTEEPEQDIEQDERSVSETEETEEQPIAAEQEEQSVEAKESPEEEPTNNHIAQKRGRMVAAGVIAAVILSVIAVGVAGIFQFTASRLMPCPEDLSVNDPAPILWKDMVEKEGPNASLGVPEKLAKEVALKEAPEANK